MGRSSSGWSNTRGRGSTRSGPRASAPRSSARSERKRATYPLSVRGRSARGRRSRRAHRNLSDRRHHRHGLGDDDSAHQAARGQRAGGDFSNLAGMDEVRAWFRELGEAKFAD